jgi:uncharacterized coiled-coil protein SlyX
MMDDIRYKKEKIRTLEMQLKYQEKINLKLTNQTQVQVKEIRELKDQIKKVGEEEKLVYNSVLEDYEPLYEFATSNDNSLSINVTSPKSSVVSNLEK